jgi:hypothetical protein
MFIRFVKDGRAYTIPVSQVVVYTEAGTPAALAYEHERMIVASDAAQPDFAQQCRELGITAAQVQIINKQ